MNTLNVIAKPVSIMRSPAMAQPRRNVRPSETMIEGRNHKVAQKHHRRHGLNNLLSPFLLAPDPGFQPSLQKRGIVLCHPHRDGARWNKKRRQASPSLPKTQCPQRNKNHCNKHDKCTKDCDQRLAMQCFHGPPMTPVQLASVPAPGSASPPARSGRQNPRKQTTTHSCA